MTADTTPAPPVIALEVRVRDQPKPIEMDLGSDPPALWLRHGVLTSEGVARLGILMDDYTIWLLGGSPRPARARRLAAATARLAADSPNGEASTMTETQTAPVCPPWCDRTCDLSEPDELQHSGVAATLATEFNDPPLLVQLIAGHGEPVKVLLEGGDHWLSLDTARALAAELLRAVELAGQP